MTPPLLLLSMLVGVNSLSLLSPRAHAAAMAPPLLARHTTPSLRLLRPPRLCMASVRASERRQPRGWPAAFDDPRAAQVFRPASPCPAELCGSARDAGDTDENGRHVQRHRAPVLASEVLKMPVCLALIARDVGVAGVRRELHQKVVEPWRDTLTMAVPALCYCLQNALFFVALSNLSAASYQLWSQSKTLSTALFFVLLLGKRLTSSDSGSRSFCSLLASLSFNTPTLALRYESDGRSSASSRCSRRASSRASRTSTWRSESSSATVAGPAAPCAAPSSTAAIVTPLLPLSARVRGVRRFLFGSEMYSSASFRFRRVRRYASPIALPSRARA